MIYCYIRYVEKTFARKITQFKALPVFHFAENEQKFNNLNFELSALIVLQWQSIFNASHREFLITLCECYFTAGRAKELRREEEEERRLKEVKKI